MGDLNLPYINWSVSYSNPNPEAKINTRNCKLKNIRDAANALCTTAISLGIVQQNFEHPAKNYTLDLVFAEPNLLTCVVADDPLIKSDQDHIPCFISVRLNDPVHDCKTLTVQYDYKNADLPALNDSLQNIQWDKLLSDTSDSNLPSNIEILENNVRIFYEETHKAFEKHI